MPIFERFSVGAAGRTAWIFGAGASAADAYGVPVQARLLRHFFEMTRPGNAAYQAQFDAVRDDVRAACARVLPGRTLPDDAIVLEELFAANEIIRDAHRSSPAERQQALDDIATLRDAIRIATQSYGRGDSKKWQPHNRNNTDSPYAQLLEHIIPANNADGRLAHTLITFNYDINLDRCLINLRAAPADRDVDYGFLFANSRCPGAPVFAAPRAERSVLLLRTHGSLNWVRCDACQSVFSSLDRHATVADDQRCYACHSLQIDNILVHPSFARQYTDPLLQIIWGRMYEELRSSRTWVFIGYSLPAADFHFREMLRSVFRARTAAGEATRAVVVTRDGTNRAQTVAEYNAIFGPAEVDEWNATANGFAEFVNRIDP